MLDKKEPLTLEHPAVQAAKAQWDKFAKRFPTSPKFSRPFAWWFANFKADEISFSEIGEELGISRERVRQIWNENFRTLFDEKSGRDRWYAATPTRQLERAQKKLSESDFAFVVNQARAAGCDVGPLLDTNNCARTRRMVVNGWLCLLYQRRVPWKMNKDAKRTYASVRFLVGDAEAVIVYVAIKDYPERVFIIPRTVLESFSDLSLGKTIRVYIPLRRWPVYNNRPPRIDWLEYENAWHLLAPKPEPAS